MLPTISDLRGIISDRSEVEFEVWGEDISVAGPESELLGELLADGATSGSNVTAALSFIDYCMIMRTVPTHASIKFRVEA